ncbi:hypothetical protein CYK00_09920 [Neisseria sicca]|uniref:MFS transporter n=1 Tax=Neisseria sicca TaxID=490 RepID=A0A2I1XAA1_NEISI|nr:MFS transporter [Neisseria sicca]PLA39566.1 hypothetical protein CYK00_09920 [Neisseria sicca]
MPDGTLLKPAENRSFATIPAAIPFLFGSIGAGWVFVCFTAMMVLQLVFVMAMMPETKGVPLEELSKSLIKEDV